MKGGRNGRGGEGLRNDLVLIRTGLLGEDLEEE
jgi:hypothetical protein